MPRSIGEIQRDLEQSNQNINDIARQSRRIDQGLKVIEEQEKYIAERALAPTQIENRKILTEIQANSSALNSTMAVMEEKISDATTILHKACNRVEKVDVASLNRSVESLIGVLQLADPKDRSELLIALDEAYEEKKRVLNEAYQEQKQEYDAVIAEKKAQAAKLDRKIKGLRIKDIIIKSLIVAAILFVIALTTSFAFRWGTILRNALSASESVSGANTGHSEESSKGIVDWLFPEK